MTKPSIMRTANQAQGRIGELQVALSLEQRDLACADLTSNDFGLDLTVQLPDPTARPRKDKGTAMSGVFINIQVKCVRNLSLRIGHLQQWHAANEVRPGSCYVAWLGMPGATKEQTLRIIGPNGIAALYREAARREQKSIRCSSKHVDISEVLVPGPAKSGEGMLRNYLLAKAFYPNACDLLPWEEVLEGQAVDGTVLAEVVARWVALDAGTARGLEDLRDSIADGGHKDVAEQLIGYFPATFGGLTPDDKQFETSLWDRLQEEMPANRGHAPTGEEFRCRPGRMAEELEGLSELVRSEFQQKC